MRDGQQRRVVTGRRYLYVNRRLLMKYLRKSLSVCSSTILPIATAVNRGWSRGPRSREKTDDDSVHLAFLELSCCRPEEQNNGPQNNKYFAGPGEAGWACRHRFG